MTERQIICLRETVFLLPSNFFAAFQFFVAFQILEERFLCISVCRLFCHFFHGFMARTAIDVKKKRQ